MDVDDDLGCDVLPLEENFNENYEVDDDLLLLNRSEENLSETQKKFAGKIKVSAKGFSLSRRKSKPTDTKNQFIKFLLQQDDLPSAVSEILNKEIEKPGEMKNMELNEHSLFWTEIYGYVKSLTAAALNNNTTKNVDENFQVLSAILSLILYCKEYFMSITSHHPLGLTVAFLNALLFTEIDLEFRFKICEVCEMCCMANISFQGKFYLDTICFLLRATLEKKDISQTIISRVWCTSNALRKINLKSKVCCEIMKYLTQIPKCTAYLSCREGRFFISFLIGRLDANLIKKFHQSIITFLTSAKRSQAALYGQIYFNAWISAQPEFRKVIEEECFQDFMTKVMTLPRTYSGMKNLGHNVFEILKYFHNNRKHAHFSKVITELYSPFLWRFLRSGNNIERCNAAEVFLHAYPLEKPGQGLANEIEFLQKQQYEMESILKDNCHIIRIIGVKGICSKLESCWNTFPGEVVQVLVRIMVQDLANDSSSANVRQAVFKGLTIMLRNPNCAEYLRKILPQMQEIIHDVNQSVRRAFVDMLIKLKQLKYSGFRFTHVVNIKHLLARLQRENSEVGKRLVTLLMDCIVSDDRDQTLLLICKMIVTDPLAARKFFKFSKHCLKFEDAVNLMKNVLVAFRSHVKNKENELLANGNEEINPSEIENEIVQPKKKKRTSERRTLNIINQNTQDEIKPRQSSEVENPYTPDNPAVSYGMMEIVSILWCLQSKELLRPENEQKLNDLHDLSGGSVPLFLRYYKKVDKNTYFAVIHLASLIPLNKLSPSSTIGSACASQIKSISETTPENELRVYVFALCAWNRGSDIIELVMNCFDQAFRSEGLNYSAHPPDGYKFRTVKFHHAEIKPILALKILDLIFSNEINQKRIMSKAYEQVYELLTYLSPIKFIVENRLMLDMPLENTLLSDDFIVQGLYRYYKMFIILHNYAPTDQQSSGTINAAKEMSEIMKWARRCVFPFASNVLEESPGLSERIINDILRTCRHILATNSGVDNEFLMQVTEFVKNLPPGPSLWFIEGSLHIIKFMIDHAEAYSDQIDESLILQTTIPDLFGGVLTSLSKSKYSQKIISTCIKNIGEVKFVMMEVIRALHQRYGIQSSALQKILRMFNTVCVAVINLDTKELQLLDPIDNVLELPYVCKLLVNVLMSRSLYINMWLSILSIEIDTAFSQDPYMLMSAISLLYTLSSHCDKFPKELLSKVLKSSYNAVSNFSEEQKQNSTSDSTCNVDVKKMVLPLLHEIASTLECDLK